MFCAKLASVLWITQLPLKTNVVVYVSYKENTGKVEEEEEKEEEEKEEEEKEDESGGDEEEEEDEDDDVSSDPDIEEEIQASNSQEGESQVEIRQKLVK